MRPLVSGRTRAAAALIVRLGGAALLARRGVGAELREEICITFRPPLQAGATGGRRLRFGRSQ